MTNQGHHGKTQSQELCFNPTFAESRAAGATELGFPSGFLKWIMIDSTGRFCPSAPLPCNREEVWSSFFTVGRKGEATSLSLV